LIADNKINNKFIKGFSGYRWIKNYTGCGKLAAAFLLAITFFILNEKR